MRTLHPVPPPVTARDGGGWEPVSVCTPGCLPASDSLPRVSSTRVALRIVGMVAVLAFTASIAGALPLLDHRRRADVLRGLFRAVLRSIGVRVVHIGPARFDSGDGAETGGVLVVANHLSWLDIVALGAVQPVRMVAKREVRGWPLIGTLAGQLGTLFVDRAALRTLPAMVTETSAALRAGAVVGLFPEGTTWCGAASGVFRRAGFQAALDAGVPVRPVAQRLLLPDGSPTTVGAFIGEDTLLDSMLRVLRLPGLVVEVRVLALLTPAPGTDRRQLARRAELAVAEATGVPAPPGVRRPVRRALPVAA